MTPRDKSTRRWHVRWPWRRNEEKGYGTQKNAKIWPFDATKEVIPQVWTYDDSKRPVHKKMTRSSTMKKRRKKEEKGKKGYGTQTNPKIWPFGATEVVQFERKSYQKTRQNYKKRARRQGSTGSLNNISSFEFSMRSRNPKKRRRDNHSSKHDAKIPRSCAAQRAARWNIELSDSEIFETKKTEQEERKYENLVKGASMINSWWGRRNHF